MSSCWCDTSIRTQWETYTVRWWYSRKLNRYAGRCSDGGNSVHVSGGGGSGLNGFQTGSCRRLGSSFVVKFLAEVSNGIGRLPWWHTCQLLKKGWNWWFVLTVLGIELLLLVRRGLVKWNFFVQLQEVFGFWFLASVNFRLWNMSQEQQWSGDGKICGVQLLI